MRHRVKKIKFRFGKDHNKMLMRKLVWNFLKHGKITTTLPRARALKSFLERIISKAKEKTEANKNVLLRQIAKPEVVEYLFEKIGPFFKTRIGGYVRIVKLLPRQSDGARMARVEWVEKPIVKKRKKKIVEKTKAKGKLEVEDKKKNAKAN